MPSWSVKIGSPCDYVKTACMCSLICETFVIAAIRSYALRLRRYKPANFDLSEAYDNFESFIVPKVFDVSPQNKVGMIRNKLNIVFKVILMVFVDSDTIWP